MWLKCDNWNARINNYIFRFLVVRIMSFESPVHGTIRRRVSSYTIRIIKLAASCFRLSVCCVVINTEEPTCVTTLFGLAVIFVVGFVRWRQRNVPNRHTPTQNHHHKSFFQALRKRNFVHLMFRSEWKLRRRMGEMVSDGARRSHPSSASFAVDQISHARIVSTIIIIITRQRIDENAKLKWSLFVANRSSFFFGVLSVVVVSLMR